MPRVGNDPTSLPRRIASRPLPTQWGATELLTLSEAASLFWPEGPITVRTLRTAVRDESLAVAWVAGKIFTTPEAIADMSKPRKPTAPPTDACEGEEAPQAPHRPPVSASAQALLDRIAKEKARLKPRPNRLS